MAGNSDPVVGVLGMNQTVPSVSHGHTPLPMPTPSLPGMPLLSTEAGWKDNHLAGQ